MIVRVGLLDKSDNYISRLANYQNVHSNEAVQFEIYLFTEEQMLRRQMGRGGRIDVLIAEEELLQSPEEYARSMELAFWTCSSTTMPLSVSVSLTTTSSGLSTSDFAITSTNSFTLTPPTGLIFRYRPS